MGEGGAIAIRRSVQEEVRKSEGDSSWSRTHVYATLAARQIVPRWFTYHWILAQLCPFLFARQFLRALARVTIDSSGEFPKLKRWTVSRFILFLSPLHICLRVFTSTHTSLHQLPMLISMKSLDNVIKSFSLAYRYSREKYMCQALTNFHTKSMSQSIRVNIQSGIRKFYETNSRISDRRNKRKSSPIREWTSLCFVFGGKNIVLNFRVRICECGIAPNLKTRNYF